MEGLSERNNYRTIGISSAVMAAAAVAVAFITSSGISGTITGALMTVAALLIIALTEPRSSGFRFIRLAVILAVAFIFSKPELLPYSQDKIAAVLLSVSFLFTLKSIEWERGDYAADASATMTVASYFCPPAIWLLIPLIILHISRSSRPATRFLGNIAGVLMAILSVSAVIFLIGGTDSLLSEGQGYLSCILQIAPVPLYFGGWRTIRDFFFLILFATTFFSFLNSRNGLGLNESGEMETKATFILSLLPLEILYGGQMYESIDILFLTLFAFFLAGQLKLSRNGKAVEIALIAYLVLSLTEILSRFIPGMNNVFCYICSL